MTHTHHASKNTSHRIGLVFCLNLFFTVIELVGGILTGSTAILADAVHDLGDTLSISIAWLLQRFSVRQANDDFTYGFHRFSLMGALINGIVLVAGSVWVMSESIPRLFSPIMPDAQGMLWFSLLGITVNGYAAWSLSHGRTLNERVLNWHLLEDVLGWVSVFIVGFILLFWNWPVLDPLLSIAFTVFILINVVKNLSRIIKLFLQSSPDKHLLISIRDRLAALNNIRAVHHIHLWSLDGEQHVLTAHLEMENVISIQQLKRLKEAVNDILSDYAFSHTTIELEFPDETCRDS